MTFTKNYKCIIINKHFGNYRVTNETSALKLFCFFAIIVPNFYIKFIFTTRMKEFRAAIIRMHERGTGKREIGRLLGIDESTVRKAIKRFEETGSNDNRKREKTARSSRNIQRAKGMIKRNDFWRQRVDLPTGRGPGTQGI